MAPVRTISKLAFSFFPNALEYLQEVIDLPDEYRDALNDPEWLNKVVPHSLQHAEPQRNLEFGFAIDTTSPDTIKAKYTFNKPNPGMVALFAYVAGVEAPSPCGRRCCQMIFKECIVADDSFVNSMSQAMRKIPLSFSSPHLSCSNFWKAMN